MKGKHHIIIETGNIKYEFDIKRNITVVQGDSATGKIITPITSQNSLTNELNLRKNPVAP